MVYGLNKLLTKLRNTGSTRRRQENERPCSWFCQWIDFLSGRCTKESQNHTSYFTGDRNLPPLVYHIVHQNLKLKCI